MSRGNATLDHQVTVQLDMNTGDLAGTIENVQTTYGVSIKIIKTHGPAGCPFVEVTGSRAQVVAALFGWWQLEQDEVSEFVGHDVIRVPSPNAPRSPMGYDLGWNHFEHYATESVTTAKLAEELDDIALHNVMVRNGDEDGGDYANSYLHVLQVTHVGGRDWVIICGVEPALAYGSGK